MARALALALALFVLPLLACGGDADAEKGPKSSKQGVTPISLAWLLRTYAENPSRADAEYRGRIFEFSATAAGVAPDATGQPAVTLETSEEGGAVSCVAGEGTTFASIGTGTTVIVRGKVVGLNTKTSMIVLVECQVVG